MTEAEWRDSTHLFGLMAFAHGRAAPRRLRAYATFWVEQVHHLLDNHSSARLAQHCREESLKSPEALARPVSEVVSWGSGRKDAQDCAEHALSALLADDWVSAALCAGRAVAIDRVYGPRTLPSSITFPEAHEPRLRFWAAGEQVVRDQLFSLRCIVGNPFRKLTRKSVWLTSTVVAVARGIDADRAFDGLPILADALQEADCDDEDVLAHCRGPGPHLKGCWVVDMLLGER